MFLRLRLVLSSLYPFCFVCADYLCDIFAEVVFLFDRIVGLLGVGLVWLASLLMQR